jgi:hypothetical protein
MKSILIFFIFLNLSLASAIREVGDGAGGVSANGSYVTFFSAHVPVIPTPLAAKEVPGLNYLLGQVQAMALMPARRQELVSFIYPTSRRQYFKGDESKMDSKQMQTLVDQYSKLTGLPQKSLTIFALTDHSTSNTVLLPNYYKLKKNTELAALLLHEAAWLNGTNNYTNVLGMELAAQAYFEDGGKDPSIYYHFYDMLTHVFGTSERTGGAQTLAHACITHDLQTTNALQSPGLPPGNIYLKDLFGESYFNCIRNSGFVKSCDSDLSMSLITRAEKNPEFLLFRFLSEYYLQHLSTFSFGDTISLSLTSSEIQNVYIDFSTPSSDLEWAHNLYLKRDRGIDKVGMFYPVL